MISGEKVITFLIGNGFDVGMGMKSQYADFYKKFIDEKSPYYPKSGENYLVRQIRHDRTNRQPHWSYYEKWFGELTQTCDRAIREGTRKVDFRATLLEQNEEFQDCFYKYLRDQEKELDLEGLGPKMLEGLRNYYSKGNIGQGEAAVIDALNKDTDPNIAPNRRKYQFVCFNYSGVIDRSVDALKAERQRRYDILEEKITKAHAEKKQPVISEQNLSVFMPEYHDKIKSTVRACCNGEKTLGDTVGDDETEGDLPRWFTAEDIGNVHHGHGALEYPEMSIRVMGVNDDTQIGENFGEEGNRSYNNRLVKMKIMESNGRKNQYKTTEKMIESSNVIVVYGMSIGDTDKKYWADIYEWLKGGTKGDTSRQLIFYMYDSSYEPLSPNNLKQIVTNHMEQFRGMAWKLDGKVKWCNKTETGERFHFMPNNCPKRFGECTKEVCAGQNLAQWCAANGLGASDFAAGDEPCEMTCCPEYEQCEEWIEIRKRIHFAIHKNIFSLK